VTINENANGGSSDRTEEDPEARNNRNLSDLLQELRVAGLGVQVLFGFLLSLPFTMRFAHLDASQRALYLASLLLAALSTALLIAPVAYHRWVFRLHEKNRLLHAANVFALVGLFAVALAISSAVLLVVSFVESGPVVPLLVAVTVVIFAFLWFALPIRERRAPPYR
jgi:uncharacterized membrane protein HdeD (DUF308 family)